ncbi:MAG TPA: HD domain-containing phosphohydrolase, partial [Candidatus Nitrosotenuis sp.]|nr:HD domain-containing phosphohydrolase [Candidatus Nitrosotenuis sp.]
RRGEPTVGSGTPGEAPQEQAARPGEPRLGAERAGTDDRQEQPGRQEQSGRQAQQESRSAQEPAREQSQRDSAQAQHLRGERRPEGSRPGADASDPGSQRERGGGGRGQQEEQQQRQQQRHQQRHEEEGAPQGSERRGEAGQRRDLPEGLVRRREEEEGRSGGRRRQQSRQGPLSPEEEGQPPPDGSRTLYTPSAPWRDARRNLFLSAALGLKASSAPGRAILLGRWQPSLARGTGPQGQPGSGRPGPQAGPAALAGGQVVLPSRIEEEERSFFMALAWLEHSVEARLLMRASRYAASAIPDLLRRMRQRGEPADEEIVNRLLALLAMGGEFTHQHSMRVMNLALALCDDLGLHDPTLRRQVQLGAAFKDLGEVDYLLSKSNEAYRSKAAAFLSTADLWTAGVLHDIGKLRIPPEILYKPEALTREEFEIIKMHPVYSEQILYRFPSLRHLCPVVRGHHERWDGKGYPDGLAGEDIPLAARIIALADVFDALFADRPYRKGMSFEQVYKIIAQGAGTHFDPDLVPTFLHTIRRLHA